VTPRAFLVPFAAFLLACGSTPAFDADSRVRRVEFTTSEGSFIVEVDRDLAPHGVLRFLTLVRAGYYDGCRFFRVLPGFVVQWGINGDPEVSSRWEEAEIPDDPVKAQNVRGAIAFATAGPDTRTTQLFVNLVDNHRRLDSRGFAPFGRVVSGMEVVDRFYSGYGEGLDQEKIHARGNVYLDEVFPRLDFIVTARVID